MNIETQSTVTTHKNTVLPRFEAIDIITLICAVGVVLLLLQDKPVPDFMIALVGLGAGVKVFPESKVK